MTAVTLTGDAFDAHSGRAAHRAVVTAGEATAALADIPGLLTDTVTRSATAPGDAVVTRSVEIPVHAADGIEFGSLTIDLPGAATADPAARVNAGTAVYPSDGSYATAVQATPDGGVRALVVIDNADAPTEYRFPMDGATHLTANPDGGLTGLTVWNGTSVVAVVAAPWAYDANGAPVATSYRIDGTTIVQTVDHHGAAYPIVADPAFQGDCGWVSCAVRLDRAQTRNARDALLVVGIITSACAVAFGLATGPFSVPIAAACGVAAAPSAFILAVFAARFYEQGDCLQMKFRPTRWGFTAEPGSVKHGTRNCR